MRGGTGLEGESPGKEMGEEGRKEGVMVVKQEGRRYDCWESQLKR